MNRYIKLLYRHMLRGFRVVKADNILYWMPAREYSELCGRKGGQFCTSFDNWMKNILNPQRYGVKICK